ncbi:MAG: hypothetical protein PHF86_10855 [Candidatus Nanoarchaeia archaeon]|nr:hypothetical protein [Candidatus Nanoarchaeia archaeon]
MDEMTYKVCIIQNPNGTWMYTGGFTQYSDGLTELITGALEKECERLLVLNPNIALLFQNGAAIEVCVSESESNKLYQAELKIAQIIDNEFGDHKEQWYMGKIVYNYIDSTFCCIFNARVAHLRVIDKPGE